MRPPRQFICGNTFEDSPGNSCFLAELIQHWFSHFGHFCVSSLGETILSSLGSLGLPTSPMELHLIARMARARCRHLRDEAAPATRPQNMTATPHTASPAPAEGRSRLTPISRFRFLSRSRRPNMRGTLATAPGCRWELSIWRRRDNAELAIADADRRRRFALWSF